jgi:single-stranded-DNA-specific exonuclease
MRATRWAIAPEDPDRAAEIAAATGLSPLLAQVLINRGIDTPELAELFLDPDLAELPSPIAEFPDLAPALDLLAAAIERGDRLGICGDYDADGMTSTALLIRAFRHLGADVTASIPSRMTDGYGINQRIVEEFHQNGIHLILTVDNGIAAYEPIARARELGMTVILTDHHDVPPRIPPANAILNPKLIDPASPYAGLAGVGVAYVLAVALAQWMGRPSPWRSLLQLFTLGTIADLAPLTGVNRRWVKRGLSLLPFSTVPGIRALQQVAGIDRSGDEQDGNANPRASKGPLKPEAIGFRLGPRINAVGRIHQPDVVIDLLTTDDDGEALERAMQCEEINQQRQQICSRIEQEAHAWYQTSDLDLKAARVMLLVQPGWHHGTIGIVASRLVERYGAPVFIGTYEEGNPEQVRGSARGIPEFNVFAALEYCKDLLTKHGGHRAAGGFSLPAANLPAFEARLREFAQTCLQPEHICPLVQPDVRASLGELDGELYEQIDMLHPCGIGNPDPVFWSPGLQVVGQRQLGQDRKHLRLTLSDGAAQMEAIAWRWGDAFPLPPVVDVAYQLKENHWNGAVNLELDVVAIRPAVAASAPGRSPVVADRPAPYQAATVTVPDRGFKPFAPKNSQAPKRASFTFRDRPYNCAWGDRNGQPELRIRNPEGKVLALVDGESTGLLGPNRETAEPVDLNHPFFRSLIAAAKVALSGTA